MPKAGTLFLRCWCWLMLVFSSLPSLHRFRLGHRLFYPVFFLWVLCCLLGFGFCCDSFSIWYTVSWYVRTLISPFNFCLRHTICFSYCVHYLLFLFSACWGNFPLQSYWSHGLHCSDELMWDMTVYRRPIRLRASRQVSRWGFLFFFFSIIFSQRKCIRLPASQRWLTGR